MNNDLISRAALLEAIRTDVAPFTLSMVFRHIHSAPRRGRGGSGEVQRLYLCPRKIWAPQMRTWYIYQQHME